MSDKKLSSENPVRVLIADRQFLITESLKSFLHNEEYAEFVEIVTDWDELKNSLKRDQFKLLIIDYSLIDIEGISELREIKKSYPALAILVITNSLSKSELQELNSSGITNIIMKTAGRDELSEAIESAFKGKKFYSNELLDMLFETGERKNDPSWSGQLTISEIEIIRLISEGLTTKEIASRKFISFHTVISHRKNIFRKLGVTSVSELIMYSIKTGLINTIEYHI